MRDSGFATALCYDRQIIQILQQFFVVADWKHDWKMLIRLRLGYGATGG